MNKYYKYYGEHEYGIGIFTLPVTFSISYTDIQRTAATMHIDMDNGDAKVENLRYYLATKWNNDPSEIPEDAVFTPAESVNKLTGLTPATYYYPVLRYEVNGVEYARYPDSSYERLVTGDVSLSVSYSNVRQTTATMKTTVNRGDAVVSDMQYSIDGGSSWQTFRETVSLSGLVPGTTYRPLFRWNVSGVSYSYTAPQFRTLDVTADARAQDVGQTAALITVTHDAGNATYVESGVYFEGEYLAMEEASRRFTELNPATTYRIRPYITTTESGRVLGAERSFTTLSISATTEAATNVSNRSAQFNGSVQCDAYSSAEFGFEWKGMGSDWLADPVFTKGIRLEDGTLTLGLVSGMLEPNKDYQFRAVVRYKGNTYVGEWKNFHTELEYVLYAAQPVTLYRTDRETNSIVFCGYYIQGSEEVTSQGYEYWAQTARSASALAAAENVIRVETGSDMLYTLDASMLNDGTYCVRAFVQTATSTYYGQTLTFGVGESVGIHDAVTESPECFGTKGHVVFRHTNGLGCRVFDMGGRMVAAKQNLADTERIPLPTGVYVVWITGGKTFKVMVK